MHERILDYSGMFKKARSQHAPQNRLVTLALVFALVFAIEHVAIHDFDVNGGDPDVNTECQLCRYNYVPILSWETPPSFTRLELFVHFPSMGEARYPRSRLFRSLWARAPPLF